MNNRAYKPIMKLSGSIQNTLRLENTEEIPGCSVSRAVVKGHFVRINITGMG